MRTVYRRQHVVRALQNLPKLRAAIQYGCAPDASDERVGRRDHHAGDGIRSELVCLVVDIDMAIAQLPNGDGTGILRHLRSVAEWYWGQGMVQEAIAEELGCSQQLVSRKLGIAQERVVRHLCGS